MKSGINQWAFTSELPTEKALKLAADIGFETFEVCLDETGPAPLAMSEQDARKIRRHAERLGIAITSVCTSLGWKYPLSSPDNTVREQGVALHARALQIAQWLGADAVLAVPGVVTPEVSYDAALEQALRSFRALADEAEKLRISVALENVWNKFLLSPVEMRDFIDQCESPYVGAYVDIGNMMLYGYPEQWIRILGKRVCKVHAKDYRVASGNMDGFVMLLEGDVNWPATVAALRASGYDGPLTAKFGPYQHGSEAVLQHCFASLKTILALK